MHAACSILLGYGCMRYSVRYVVVVISTWRVNPKIFGGVQGSTWRKIDGRILSFGGKQQ